MSILSRINYDVTDNPVAVAEAKHLRRSAGKWFWRVVYLITIYVLLAPVIWGFTPDFFQALNNAVGVLGFMNVVGYLLVGLKVLTNAVSAITRERTGKTWELLVLTGMDSRRIVMGKWLGVMRHLLRDYVWLYVLRLGLLFWIMVNNSVGFVPFGQQSTLRLLDTSLGAGDVARFLVAAVMLLLFAGFDLAFMTALGIVTALVSRGDRAGTWVALVVRVGLAIGLVLGAVYLGGMFLYQNSYTGDQNAFTILMTAAGSMSDTGAITSIVLVEGSEPAAPIIIGQLIGLSLFPLLTWLALRIAQFSANWRGVTEPGILLKVKPKRLPDSKAKRQPDPIAEIVDEPAVELGQLLADDETHARI